MIEFLIDSGDQLVTVLVAALAYFGGLKAFYRQKEYELVRQRYLTDGLDLIAGDFEHALQLELQIFHRSLAILRQYREMGDQLPIKMLKAPLPELNMGRFHTIASHRVHTLTGNTAFWEGLQLLYARVQQYAYFHNDELVHAIEMILAERYEDPNKAETVKLLSESVVGFHEQMSRDFSLLLGMLNALGKILEGQRFTLKRIERFSTRPEVQAIAERANKLVNEAAMRRPAPAGVVKVR